MLKITSSINEQMNQQMNLFIYLLVNKQHRTHHKHNYNVDGISSRLPSSRSI